LQRRLTEQGITLQRLLEEARRELARHYLLHSSRELNETAYLLGYEDANSSFRAFHLGRDFTRALAGASKEVSADDTSASRRSVIRRKQARQNARSRTAKEKGQA